jgi:hypothetical protein
MTDAHWHRMIGTAEHLTSPWRLCPYCRALFYSPDTPDPACSLHPEYPVLTITVIPDPEPPSFPPGTTYCPACHLVTDNPMCASAHDATCNHNLIHLSNVEELQWHTGPR